MIATFVAEVRKSDSNVNEDVNEGSRDGFLIRIK